MTDLLAMSSDIIDGRKAPGEMGPLNRITHELSELSNDLAVVEAFAEAELQVLHIVRRASMHAKRCHARQHAKRCHARWHRFRCHAVA